MCRDWWAHIRRIRPDSRATAQTGQFSLPRIKSAMDEHTEFKRNSNSLSSQSENSVVQGSSQEVGGSGIHVLCLKCDPSRDVKLFHVDGVFSGHPALLHLLLGEACEMSAAEGWRSACSG